MRLKEHLDLQLGFVLFFMYWPLRKAEEKPGQCTVEVVLLEVRFATVCLVAKGLLYLISILLIDFQKRGVDSVIVGELFCKPQQMFSLLEYLGIYFD